MVAMQIIIFIMGCFIFEKVRDQRIELIILLGEAASSKIWNSSDCQGRRSICVMGGVVARMVTKK